MNDFAPKHLNRRDVLKILGLGSAASLLTACAPQLADWDPTAVPEPMSQGAEWLQNQEQVTDEYIAAMESTHGKEWRTELSNGISSLLFADVDANTPASVLMAKAVTSAAMDEAPFQQTFLRRAYHGVLSSNNPVLADMIAQLEIHPGGKNLDVYYYELAHQGFVMHDPETKTWYKFANTLDNGNIQGYQQQAMEIWKRNLASWGLDSSGLKIGTTQIGESKYIYTRTPNIGKYSIESAMEGKIFEAFEGGTEQAVKELMLDWVKESSKRIAQGEFSTVQWDPNPGNIRLVEDPTSKYGYRAVPIDWDVRPMAFTDTDTAVRVLGQRMSAFYGPRTEEAMFNFSVGKRPQAPFVLTEAEISQAIEAGYGRAIALDAKAVQVINVKIPQALEDGGNFGFRLFVDPAKIKGTPSRAFQNALDQQLATISDVLPENIQIQVPLTASAQATEGVTTRSIDIRFNAGGSIMKAIPSTNLRVAEFLKTMTPYLKAGATALDILGLSYLAYDINRHMTKPWGYVGPVDLGFTTQLAEVTGLDIGQKILINGAHLCAVLKTEYAGAARGITTVGDVQLDAGFLHYRSTWNREVYPFFYDLVDAISEVTQLPVTKEQQMQYGLDTEWTLRAFSNDERAHQLPELFQRWVGNQVHEAMLQAGIWVPITLEGVSISGISNANFMSATQEMESNIVVSLQKLRATGVDSDTTEYMLTFGAYNHELQRVAPIVGIPYSVSGVDTQLSNYSVLQNEAGAEFLWGGAVAGEPVYFQSPENESMAFIYRMQDGDREYVVDTANIDQMSGLGTDVLILTARLQQK